MKYIGSFVHSPLKVRKTLCGRRTNHLLTPNFHYYNVLPRDNDLPNRGASFLFSSTDIDPGVLSNEDILIGTILAFGLAFLFSFLQGRTPSSSNIVLWRNEKNDRDELDSLDRFIVSDTDPNSLGENFAMNDERKKIDERVFDGDMWKEMSRPENYSVYTRRERRQENDRSHDEESKGFATIDGKNEVTSNSGKKENKLVLISLLILFVPIFSVEFFFALSRQFICGDYLTSVDDSLWIMDVQKATSASNGSSPWAAQLCSPAYIPR